MKTTDTITITVRRESVHFEQYESTAAINGEEVGAYYGASPDEAIGWAIRELWLGGHVGADCLPFRLDLDIKSDEPALSS